MPAKHHIAEIVRKMSLTEQTAQELYNKLYDEIMATIKGSMHVMTRSEKDKEISRTMIAHGFPPGRYAVLEQHLSAYFGQEVV